MNPQRLKELLAEYALENPERPLSEVGVIEFAEWYAMRDAVQRLMRSWDAFEADNRALPPERQRD